MRLYDVTLPLSPALAVFPGDVPFSLQRTLTIGPGAPINLSALTMTAHCGTHADAPFHYDAGGQTMEAVDLTAFLGPALVADLDGLPASLPDRVERLLVRTGACPDPSRWYPEFPPLPLELVTEAARRGCRLVGVDTPSVDAAESKELPVHKACARLGLYILENLALTGVPNGRYELIALPLRIAGGDASPVRAVLRAIDTP